MVDRAVEGMGAISKQVPLASEEEQRKNKHQGARLPRRRRRHRLGAPFLASVPTSGKPALERGSRAAAACARP